MLTYLIAAAVLVPAYAMARRLAGGLGGGWAHALWIAMTLGGGSVGYDLPGRSGATTMQMGRPKGASQAVSWSQWWKDFGLMTFHGLGGVAPLGSVLGIAAFYGVAPAILPAALLAAGLLVAPAYELAYRLHLNIPALGVLHDLKRGLDDPCPLGELLQGAMMGAALAAAFT